MPRQNRVDPFGELIASEARGTLMGNRGRLHDAQGDVTHRQWTTKAWIACRLEFRDRHRRVMTPGRYTELFFLDEATALAAGHRPCAECRREDYRRFKSAWVTGNPQFDLTTETPVQKVDAILHRDRVSDPALAVKVFYEADIDKLPDGVFIAGPGPREAWMIWGDQVLHWSPQGYEAAQPRPEAEIVRVLTPRSIVGAIDAGYRPEVHPSAWKISDQPVPPLP